MNSKTCLTKRDSRSPRSAPSISVCLCTYNGQKYIHALLESLISQTRNPDEIVVFDDCSTDNTLKIIEDFAASHPNISWIIHSQKENQGWRINFEKCIKAAEGEILFLCDQDDIWLPNKIEKMVEVLQSSPEIELLASNYKTFYETGGEKVRAANKCSGIVRRLKRPSSYTVIERPGCTFAIRKSLLMPFFLSWDQSFPHDALLWRLSFLRKSLFIYEDQTIIWRRHASAATNERGSKTEENAAAKRIQLIRYLIACTTNIHKLPNTISMIDEKMLAGIERFYKKRLKLLKTHNRFEALSLFFCLKYYASIKSLLYDIFLIFKKPGTASHEKKH